MGGVRDEAEIRGHRRTYVGAIPGRIMHALQRGETRNPVLMLDEVDKMGADVRGDPTAALLEVLDPAQNHTFVDHYLEVPFDLSGVMFIATANSLAQIPDPLLDRMEVLTLAGYTPGEKLAIAKRYLLPRQLKETGLAADLASVADGALERLIGEYTREAGVRQLEREIQGVLRKAARQVVEEGRAAVKITAKNLEEFAGQPKVQNEVAGRAPEIGVATGLAWTPAGGDIMFVEAIQMPGRGPDHAHRTAGRRDERVGAGGLEPAACPRRRPRDSAETFARPTCTCTCRPARCPRTGRRPGSRSPRRWPRCCAAGRRATTWR